jgi:hypothetical protein
VLEGKTLNESMMQKKAVNYYESGRSIGTWRKVKNKSSTVDERKRREEREIWMDEREGGGKRIR